MHVRPSLSVVFVRLQITVLLLYLLYLQSTTCLTVFVHLLLLIHLPNESKYTMTTSITVGVVFPAHGVQISDQRSRTPVTPYYTLLLPRPSLCPLTILLKRDGLSCPASTSLFLYRYTWNLHGVTGTRFYPANCIHLIL